MVCGGGEFSIFVFLFSFFPLVSVPLRGKEGAGPLVIAWVILRSDEFPSPCGVRRVRDDQSFQGWVTRCDVSVPLRGKEGAGR